MRVERLNSFVPFWATVLLVTICSISGAYGQTTLDWNNPAGGSYGDVFNWTPLGTPNTTTESARFNIDSTYNVTISIGPTTVSDLLVQDGNVTLASNGFLTANYVTDDDVVISGGGILTLSQTGGSGDMRLTVGDDLTVNTGGLFAVDSGSEVTTADLVLGTSGVGLTSLIGVDGIGTSFTRTNTTPITIGQNGATGELIFRNSATANINGTLTLTSSGNDASASFLNVESDADLELDSLIVGASGASSLAHGNVLVSGNGATITQTGASILTIGTAAGNIGNLNVDPGGVFTTGTGTTTVHATGTISIFGGTFNANGQMNLSSGSTLLVDGDGQLNISAGLNNSAGGDLDFRDGTINVLGGAFAPTSGGLTIDGADAADLPLLTISNGLATTISGNLVVGNFNQAEIRIEDGSVVTAANATLGGFATASGTATVTGVGSQLNLGALFVGFDGTASLLVEQEGEVSTTSGEIGSNGTVKVSGNGSQWTSTATIQVKGGELIVESEGKVESENASISGGLATITDAGSNWTVNQTLNLGLGGAGAMLIEGGGTVSSGSGILGNASGSGTVTVTGSDGMGTPSTWTNSGSLSIATTAGGAGTMTVADGGRVENVNGSIGDDGSVLVTGSESIWTNDGNLTVGQLSGLGTLDVEDNGQVEVGGLLRIQNGTLTIDGGSVTTNTFTNNEGGELSFLAGTITINSGADVGGNAFPTGLSLAAHQHLISPVATTIAPLRTLKLDGGTLTTNDLVVNGSLQFHSGILELTGGTITGLTSLAVPTSGEFRASGVHSLRVAGAVGSTITAIGNLTVGDASDSSGFYTNGALVVGEHTLTLADANDAVLDSGASATLGDQGSFGTLRATNGLTLDFGGNVTGYGTVDTPDDPLKPFINNGHIAGNSMAEPITLEGYVKGVGTMDNVVITGTSAPGFSPATVNYGSVEYAGTLEIELAGLLAGSFDKIIHSGVAELGGVLDVSLINGFVPAVGNTFEILTAASGVNGTFSTEILPSLGGGLDWDVSYGTNNVVLSVVTAGLPGDFDFDGDVDGRDFLIWQRGNSPNPLSAGDLADWQGNYGTQSLASSLVRSPPAEVGSPSPVPEPTSSLLLFAAGGVAMLIRNR